MCSLIKLVGRQVENHIQPAGSIPISVPASVPEEQEVCCSSLLFLRDILSVRDFLVNFRASVSVFPGPTSASSYRVRLLTATFLLWPESKVYSWNFHLPPVSVPLLGADFLHHFDLLEDVKGR